MMINIIIIACGLMIAGLYGYSAHQIPTTIGDPIGPRTFPYLVTAGILISLGWLGLESIRKRRLVVEQAHDQGEDPPNVALLAVVIFSTGLYYLAIEPAGFVLSTSVYLFALSSALDRKRMVMNAIVSITLAISLYLLFNHVLKSSLPKGVIFG